MRRKTCHIFSKTLIILLLSLILSLPLSTHASDKTLVLFPLLIYADQPKEYLRQALKSMFVSRLSGGGLEVIGDEAFESLLKEEEKKGIASEKRAEELASHLKADYAIFGSITVIGGGYSLDLSIIELTGDGSKLTKVSEAVNEDQFIPKLADVAYQFRSIIEGIDIRTLRTARAPSTAPPEDKTAMGLFFQPETKSRAFQPTGKMSVKMGVMAFDTGDLNGDGEPEWAILGRKKLLIYNRKGESPVLMGHLEPSLGEDFLKVSVGDADKDGKAEIYLVSRYGERARTTVFEWAGGFKRRDQQTGHMQVVKGPDRPNSVLLFQDSRVDRFFSGRISVMDYDKEGRLVQKDVLPDIEGVQFYTLALFDLDRDGQVEFLGLGEKSYLQVWDKEGKSLWRSDEKIGGTDNSINVGVLDKNQQPLRVSFNSRIAITDVDKDGKKEILVIKNIPMISGLQYLTAYLKSNLIAYSIEGTSLVQAWKTRTINYCLTDIQTEGETLFVAAQQGKFENISKGSGRIMWFE